MPGIGSASHYCRSISSDAYSGGAVPSDPDVSEPDGAVHAVPLAGVFPIVRNLFMNPTVTKTRKLAGRVLSVAIVTAALALGLIVIHRAGQYPRTDDSEILANFIGIAPQVEGPILRLNVHDNQLVKPGELLFEIDDRPYRYALERANSDQATLEGQIADERRKI